MTMDGSRRSSILRLAHSVSLIRGCPEVRVAGPCSVHNSNKGEQLEEEDVDSYSVEFPLPVLFFGREQHQS